MRRNTAINRIREVLITNPTIANGMPESEETLYEELYEHLWPNDSREMAEDPYLEEMWIEHEWTEDGGHALLALRVNERRRGTDSNLSVSFRRRRWGGTWEQISEEVARSTVPPGNREESRELATAASGA